MQLYFERLGTRIIHHLLHLFCAEEMTPATPPGLKEAHKSLTLFDGHEWSKQLAPQHPSMHALKAFDTHLVISGFEVTITLG